MKRFIFRYRLWGQQGEFAAASYPSRFLSQDICFLGEKVDALALLFQLEVQDLEAALCVF